jgi:Methyltransferase domain
MSASRFDERAALLQLTDLVGALFGTEDFCLFLYSLVKMHTPKTVVELGTGFGNCAFWMALAAKHSEVGHVWSVDDLSFCENYPQLLARCTDRFAGTVWEGLIGLSGRECLDRISELLGVQEHLTFVPRQMDLSAPGHFDDYPMPEEVDLLFSDFVHGPYEILQILGHFLPRMAPASSIFIDGASTVWSSFLLLELLVEQLNRGVVPSLLQQRSTADLLRVMAGRRIVLVHLSETKDRNQNSTAWLKIEPVDLQPHPATAVRGLG